MGKVINFELDEESCYNFAQIAFKDENYILCVQNINEGLSMPKLSGASRAKFLELLIMVYDSTRNNAAKMDIIIKNAPDCLGDYEKIDFKEFISLDDIVSIEEDGDYNEIFSYNLIKNSLISRDYCTAFGKILSTELSERYLIKIADLICLAYEEDKSFNINDYFVPAITMLAKMEDKTKLISVMLACGGACKDLAIDGMGVFVDDIDDMTKLLTLGEMYYINGELRGAKDIYKKALQFNNYSEDALFHLAAIAYAKGDISDAEKYFAKYKALFINTYLPISTYEKYFESGYAKTTTVVYPYLDTNFVDEVAREVISDIQTNGITAFTLKQVAGVISTCEREEDCFILPLLPTILTSDKLQIVILNLLGNPSINNSIKAKLLNQLYNSGYQGRYRIYYDSKLITASMVALGGEHSKFYADLYRDIMLELPFTSAYIPLKCNILKNVILKVEQAIAEPQIPDIKYFIMLVLQNYVKTAKLLVEWDDITEYLRIDSEEVLKFFAKYGITKWIIK